MRISYWSSDVCSSDLRNPAYAAPASGGTAWTSSPVTGGAMTTLRRHLRGNQPLQFFLHKLDGWRFQSDRADYYDYLSDSSAERRVGKECVSKCRSWWVSYHSKKTQHRL